MKKHICIPILFLLFILNSCSKVKEIKNTLDPRNSKIKTIENEFDFGEISIKDTLIHTFLIKNISKNELTLVNVESNCDCTTSNFTKNAVKENDTARIKMQFIPSKKGYIEKSIVIEANTSPPYTVLTIKGNVK